jgi:flagellar biosynthesis protein FlhA
LLSTAMGIMVTRAASDSGLGDDLARQLLSHPGALRAVGASMLLLAAVPGLPHLAFGLLGLVGIASGAAANRTVERRRLERTQEEARRRRAQARQPDQAVALLGVDQLAIDVGESLLSLLDEPAAGALLGRIAVLRHRMALELGIVIPGVRVRDDARLPARGFAIRVRDRVVARGELHADRALAIGPPAALSTLKGLEIADPVTGIAARWLDPAGLHQVDGAIVVDPVAVLTSKLAVIAREHAASLLGRQEVQNLVDHVRKSSPAVVKGVIPEIAGIGLVQRVLQQLAREGVSIRDIVAILESIADEVERTKDVAVIGEAARRKLAPSICASLADGGGQIEAAVLTPAYEARLIDATIADERGPALALDVDDAAALAARMHALAPANGRRIVICCAQPVRLPLARFAELCDAKVSVLGFAEVAAGYAILPKETLEPAASK